MVKMIIEILTITGFYTIIFGIWTGIEYLIISNKKKKLNRELRVVLVKGREDLKEISRELDREIINNKLDSMNDKLDRCIERLGDK